ncbi:hypothetical protein [Neglectibacter caecimuris]|uniref:hypothetical protein n=1 Tax=Neglectibacter caecimuris TaxID=3093658 RepID=UPI002AC8EA28|nr:hypothetical protein [Neglectibacter sp. M00184]
MKIITICGSLRFQQEMLEAAEKLELRGNCVLAPIYPVRRGENAYTEEELSTLNAMHREKIRLSDAVFVVNVNGYIGSSTKSEIEFAESLGKEVLYYAGGEE